MRKIDPVERHLFFEAVLMRYGFDFRHYSQASVDRRINSILSKRKMNSLGEVTEKILGSKDFFREILPEMTVGTTSFFRDPLFFKELREVVMPQLKTYHRVNIWIAGCSTGEEVISLLIILLEEGLLDRTTVYATDINPRVLRKARTGIYESAVVKDFNLNYAQSGGRLCPSDYYDADYGFVKFKKHLFEEVVFTEHNLATDDVFLEAHLILCRNVLIYFDRKLQNRVLNLFSRSLVYKGFLGIGSRESLRFSVVNSFFDEVNANLRLYSLNTRMLSELNELDGAFND